MNHRAIQALGTFTERQAWHRRLAQERPQEPWTQETDDDQQEGDRA